MEVKVRITSFSYSCTPVRKEPRTGDRRTTKKHGLQIRIPERINGCTHVNSRGKPYYVWVKPADLPTVYHYLLSKEERETLT